MTPCNQCGASCDELDGRVAPCAGCAAGDEARARGMTLDDVLAERRARSEEAIARREAEIVERKVLAMALYVRGKSVRDVADIAGLSPAAVGRAIQKLGMSRPWGTWPSTLRRRAAEQRAKDNATEAAEARLRRWSTKQEAAHA